MEVMYYYIIYICNGALTFPISSVERPMWARSGVKVRAVPRGKSEGAKKYIVLACLFRHRRIIPSQKAPNINRFGAEKTNLKEILKIL